MKTYPLLWLIGFVTIVLIAGMVVFIQTEEMTGPTVTIEETATTTPSPSPIPVSDTTIFNQPTSGVVSGTVTVGPVCPVERIDEPCVVPPETYTSRSVVVFAADGIKEITRSPLDATGKYSLPLVSGMYMLQIQPAGIGAGEMKLVTIVANQTVTVDFDIDTGIR